MVLGYQFYPQSHIAELDRLQLVLVLKLLSSCVQGDVDFFHTNGNCVSWARPTCRVAGVGHFR
jgi:hypothetical protein